MSVNIKLYATKRQSYGNVIINPFKTRNLAQKSQIMKEVLLWQEHRSEHLRRKGVILQENI